MAIKDSLWAYTKQVKANNDLRSDDNSERYGLSWLYYLGKRPLNQELPTPEQIAKGEVPALEHVEKVVEKSVDQITPQVLNLYTEDDQKAVTFRDLSFRPNPVMQEIINTEINQVVLSRNAGHKILEDALKEALISGDCFSKIYIDENHEEDKMDIPDWTSMEDIFMQLAEKNWSVDLPKDLADGSVKKGEEGALQWKTVKVPVGQPSQDPQTAAANAMGNQRQIMLMGTLDIYRVTKFVGYCNVGLKDLIIDTSCGSDFEKCRYICHKMNMTVGEAMSAYGYKADALKNASTVNRMGDAPFDKHYLVSNGMIGNTLQSDYTDEALDPLERMITIYEHYIYSSIPSKGKVSELFQVRSTDEDILEWEKLDEWPWVHGQIKTIPDSFWGRSLYDIFHSYQDLESKNVRLAYRNAFNATYNKVLVTKGAYNQESLVNSNRPGAIIVQNLAGGVQPWPYQELPQSFGMVAQQIQASRQETLGGMSGNINTEEGVSENMAAQTMAMILAQEGMKSKVIAKTFSETYVRKVMEKVYGVMKGNGMKITIPKGYKFTALPAPLEQDETITSDMFPDRFDFIVDINTDGDVAMQNRQLATVTQMLATVPTNDIVTSSSKFKVATQLLKAVDLDINDFYSDPSTQQPSPAQQELEDFQKELAKWNMQKVISECMVNASVVNKNDTASQSTVQETMAKIEVMTQESLAKMSAQHVDSIKQMHDAEMDKQKLSLDSVAVAAEIQQGAHDITIKDANTMIDAHKAINGIRQ